jgi:putative transposase
LLKLAKLSKSTFFYILKSFNSIDKDSYIKDIIISIFNENNARYGYRRITLELSNRGLIVNHKKVKRIMKQLGLFGKTPRSKYKSYKGEVGKTTPNLLLVKEIDEVKHKTIYLQFLILTAWTLFHLISQLVQTMNRQ